LGRKGAKKNRAKPGLFRSSFYLAKNGIAKAAAYLGQLSKRKLLNFNSCFNDCHIHDNPLLRVKYSNPKNAAAEETTSGWSFLEE